MNYKQLLKKYMEYIYEEHLMDYIDGYDRSDTLVPFSKEEWNELEALSIEIEDEQD